MRARLAVRALLFVLGLTAAVLLFSGAYSLWTRDSILNLGSGRAELLRLGMLDAERQQMAAMTVGPYIVDPDPEVAMRMKGKTFDNIGGAVSTADAHGQRIRSGPEPEPGATRILLLGDSVAWSWGLADTDTWDHQLEQVLASTMAAGSPRAAVYSLACPGWNYRNAFRAVLDDLARYDPDVVIYIPVENDLDDSFSINEVGHREPRNDPALGQTRPSFGSEHYWFLMAALHTRFPTRDLLARLLAGGRETVEYSLLTDLTPTSRRCWADLTARLADVQRRLESQGVHFATLLRVANPNQLLWEYKVGEAVPDHRLLTLFETFEPTDKIPDDGHPDARYVGAAVRCIAEWLIEQGWVPGASIERLPPLEPEFAARRRSLRPPEQLRAWYDGQKATWAGFMETGASFEDGLGCHQIYGGVAIDGAVGRHFAVGLRNPRARAVELTIERLPPNSRVYPLALQIHFNGEPGATLDVPPPASAAELATTLRFEVPATDRDAAYLDVQVDSSNWVAEVFLRRTRLVAYRLVAIRLVE